LKITFILPVVLDKPVGGFKVVYEYASRLSGRGHDVSVVHRRNPGERQRKRKLRETLLPWTKKYFPAPPVAPWFPMPPEVALSVAAEVTNQTVPDADAVIATAWKTAAWVSRLSAAKGKKYYLIQHDEVSFGSPDEVNATWRMPLQKIVIAKWLKDKAERLGEKAVHIPNGMDFAAFGADVPLDDRPARIGMLYHSFFDWKGSADGVEALEIVKAAFPGLDAALFGTEPRPALLPDWMEYTQLPSAEALKALYNACAIFVQSSWAEGWGLTATEAMACGCALVTTDNGGSRDYAVHEKTALVAPPKQPALLAAQIERLLADDALRRALAEAGCLHVQQYSWTAAVDNLECLLTAHWRTH